MPLNLPVPDTPPADLVPHAGAMCLLAGILAWDESSIRCRADSHRCTSNPLREGEQLPVVAGIEYAAQAVAVHGSLLARRQQAGYTPRQGMIAVLGDVQWQVERLDTCADELLVEATRIAELPQGLQYRFQLLSAGAVLLQGELIIALQANPT